MNIETNLKGRLRNTPLPLSNGLLPLFEAVVNSIHAIEEASVAPEQGRIRVAINRAPEQRRLAIDDDKRRRGPEPQSDIVGFTVTDNGIGFNEENIKAFKTLDTDHKASKGCKGIGRLLWLKAFKRVEVSSCFVDEAGQLKRRSFSFEPAAGIGKETVVSEDRKVSRTTTVSLVEFDPRYRKNAYKSAEGIANAIFEHCLWYLVRPGGTSRIIIEDGDKTIDLDAVYAEHMHSSAKEESIDIKGKVFDLLHVKLRSSSSLDHAIAYCADNRLVCEEKITGKVPGLYGKLSDENGEFIYVCYVSSEVLNESARPERTGFDLARDVEGLFSETEIALEDIRSGVSVKAAEHLAEHLGKVRQLARDRIQRFVMRAPRYRPIVGRLSEDALNIDPEISDKELDVTLHRHLAELEGQLLAEGHDLMVPRTSESSDDYRRRLDSYLRTAEDIKKSDLANYVSHRKVILDLLEAALRRQPDGKYAREDVIHSLIMPMRRDSTEELFDSCNLWVVDERLAFHDYLASDKPLSAIPITGASDNKEPDIVALNILDNPVLVSNGTTLPLASIIVIEIKRPMRNDAGPGEKDDPIEQALGYLERIRKGKVTTATGRPIPKSEEIPGFCYVICDITPSIEERCRIHDLTRTSDGMGYFSYKSSFKAYVEVISFDRLVNSAKERNRAFFDKLGLPTT